MSMYRKKRKCDGVWVWYVQYFDPAGKRRTEQAGTTRDAAMRLYGQRLEEVRNGKWEATETRRRKAQAEAMKQEGLSFHSLTEAFKQGCLDRYARPREVVDSLDRVVRFFGDQNVETITRLQVETYKKERLNGVGHFAGFNPVKACSVNRELTYARRVLNWAVYEADMPISKNIFARYRRLNELADRRKARILTPEELGQLLAAAEDRLKPVLLTAWYTGMRHAEVVNLRKRNLTLPWRRITLDKSKNGDKRSVLVDSRLLPVLSAAYDKAESPDSYLFPGRKGRPLNIRKPFEEARKAAGLPDLWFHDLRKASVTYQRGAGHDDKVVASNTGHRDLRANDLYMTPTDAQRLASIGSIPSPVTADHLQTVESTIQPVDTSSPKSVAFTGVSGPCAHSSAG